MPNNDFGKVVGFALLRIFFAQFWILQFFGKIFDQESHIIAWHNLSIWSAHTTEWFQKLTPLPYWMVRPYTLTLPYWELSIGLCLALGFLTRKSLIFSALLIISLDAGLMLQLKHDVVALNSVYLILILTALQWEPFNRWSLDSLLAKI